MLNRPLHQALRDLTGQPVGVSNPGITAIEHPKGHEQYRFACPVCGSSKAYCSYLFASMPSGPHMGFDRSRWNCFKCGTAGDDRRVHDWVTQLHRIVQYWRSNPDKLKATPLVDSTLAEKGPDGDDTEDMGPTMPHGCVPIADLPAHHPAIQFLQRKYNIPLEYFTDTYFCGVRDPDYPMARNRIVWPIVCDGVFLGWQGRSVDPHNDIRWYTSPGIALPVWRLDTLDPAVDVPVVAEGIPSALACGRCGVATFGKELSGHQLELLTRFPRVVLALDPETFLPDQRSGGTVFADKMAQQLRERGVQVDLLAWPADILEKARVAVSTGGSVVDPADIGPEGVSQYAPAGVVLLTVACASPGGHEWTRPTREMPVDTSTTELPAPPIGDELWVYDLEVLPNYFMACFTNGRQWVWFYHNSLAALVQFLSTGNKVLAGFNNSGYDDPLLTYLCHNPGASADDIFRVSYNLINSSDKSLMFELGYRLSRPWRGSIDVMALLPGRRALKELQASHGFGRIFESPISFDKALEQEQVDITRAYCSHDVAATRDLLLQYWDRVTLRQKLLELFPVITDRIYTMAEPKIAERLFMGLHREVTGENRADVEGKRDADPDNTADAYPLKDVVSKWVAYDTPVLQRMLSELLSKGRVQKTAKGGWELVGVDSKMEVAGVTVQLGVGGLHSVDQPGVFREEDGWTIRDADVGSMYPSMIIAMGIGPSQLGGGFHNAYTALRDRRLAAKAAGDKLVADAYKLVLNSFYGQLNNRYSPLYAPLQAWRVTLNGQLFLMMLMEQIALAGGEVLSVNTDGVTYRCRHEHLPAIHAACAAWEAKTRLSLEEVEYQWVVRRDVNNYIALPMGSSQPKVKGVYGKGNSNQAPVVRRAVVDYLVNGVPVEETVNAAPDLLDFAYNKRVRGATITTEDGVDVGSITRWVVGAGDHRLYRTKGEKRTAIGGSAGFILIDDLYAINHAAVRAAIDLQYYIDRATELIAVTEAVL